MEILWKQFPQSFGRIAYSVETTFPQNFHTSKLSEILVFLHYFMINDAISSKVYTESFKGLRLDPDGFYWVLLPLGIRWALLKYHIKPLGIMKNLRFLLKPSWVWFVFIPTEITWSLQRYYIELKGILKKTNRFY